MSGADRFSPRRVVLGYHGTAGAEAALRLALAVATPRETALIHAYALPSLWAGMLGDDWLNNAATREDFARYLERELASEAEEACERVAQACKEHGIAYRTVVRCEEPDRLLLTLADECAADLVLVGPPRPRGESGLRSYLDWRRLARDLPCPLLVARR